MEARTDVDAGRTLVNHWQPCRCELHDFMRTLHSLDVLDGDSDQITFLNGVTKRATTHGSAASPGSGFLTGIEPPKSRRPLSSAVSVVVVFLTQWAAVRRGGGFLGGGSSLWEDID